LSGARELGFLTSPALLAKELVLARDPGLLTSLALLAGELVLAMETETCFPLETGIRFPLGSETETHFPLETGIRFPLELETNTRFPLEETHLAMVSVPERDFLKQKT
jgi:hypothetical protein